MVAINSVTDLVVENDIAVLTLNSPPVNALSTPLRAGLLEGINAADLDLGVQCIVLICAGRTFIAGADLAELAIPIHLRPPSLFDVQDRIENASKPVIAAIHGTALGGGFEVALVCHYRVAVPTARLGLPEVNIGLLSGAGGTQRLPRAVGVGVALEMATSGRHVPAPECLELGLIDALVEEGRLREGAIAFARQIAVERRPLRRLRNEDEKLVSARGRPDIFDKFRKTTAERFRGLRAPVNIIKAIEAAVKLPFEEGLKEERRLFADLAAGDQAPALQYCFFAERQARKTFGTSSELSQLIGERMLARSSEANNALLADGVLPWDIDRLLYNFGFPIGPFLESDLAGIDAGRSKAASRGETIRDLLCQMGRRGKKTGGGFYDFDLEGSPQPSSVTESLIRKFALRSGLSPSLFSDDEILHRALYSIINEGARILGEGNDLRPSDIDFVWVSRHGWPNYRGGPLYYADQIGLGKVCRKLREFHRKYGDTWKPAPLLEKLADEARGFRR